ncbi:MAG: hypothetical protein EZS28_031439 [Streblomastix strix]|uniref:Uncharacterized protein n=1 Tax=Streblomastix strix TaxID=222440 RepID=A0A5J4URQ2_9EUKA|nr:MAG: hypothetical protein EZS28_031439 [Streblomastix strix]
MKRKSNRIIEEAEMRQIRFTYIPVSSFGVEWNPVSLEVKGVIRAGQPSAQQDRLQLNGSDSQRTLVSVLESEQHHRRDDGVKGETQIQYNNELVQASDPKFYEETQEEQEEREPDIIEYYIGI